MKEFYINLLVYLVTFWTASLSNRRHHVDTEETQLCDYVPQNMITNV